MNLFFVLTEKKILFWLIYSTLWHYITLENREAKLTLRNQECQLPIFLLDIEA